MTLTLTITGTEPGDVACVLAGGASDDCPEISVRWVGVHHVHPLRTQGLSLDVESLTLPEGAAMPPCALCLTPLVDEEEEPDA